MTVVGNCNSFQPPAATASFFERMKFIIEDQGLQSYVQRKGFNERSVRLRMQSMAVLFNVVFSKPWVVRSNHDMT